MSTVFNNITQEVEISPDGMSNKMLLKDDSVKVVLFGFAAGQGLSKHTAPVPVIIQFLQGEAEVTFADKQVTARANTLIHLPAKVPHSIVATTDTRMMLTMLVGAK